MSRSYRKTPIYKEGYGSNRVKVMKQVANRKVRKCKDVPNYKAFKKYFTSWEIHDFKCFYPEYRLDKYRNDEDYEEHKNWWRKIYVRK